MGAPCTPDGLPLIGVTRDPRVFVAGGHGMWGITLGPVTGRLLASRWSPGWCPPSSGRSILCADPGLSGGLGVPAGAWIVSRHVPGALNGSRLDAVRVGTVMLQHRLDQAQVDGAHHVRELAGRLGDRALVQEDVRSSASACGA